MNNERIASTSAAAAVDPRQGEISEHQHQNDYCNSSGHRNNGSTTSYDRNCHNNNNNNNSENSNISNDNQKNSNNLICDCSSCGSSRSGSSSKEQCRCQTPEFKGDNCCVEKSESKRGVAEDAVAALGKPERSLPECLVENGHPPSFNVSVRDGVAAAAADGGGGGGGGSGGGGGDGEVSSGGSNVFHPQCLASLQGHHFHDDERSGSGGDGDDDSGGGGGGDNDRGGIDDGSSSMEGNNSRDDKSRTRGRNGLQMTSRDASPTATNGNGKNNMRNAPCYHSSSQHQQHQNQQLHASSTPPTAKTCSRSGNSNNCCNRNMCSTKRGSDNTIKTNEVINNSCCCEKTGQVGLNLNTNTAKNRGPILTTCTVDTTTTAENVGQVCSCQCGLEKQHEITHHDDYNFSNNNYTPRVNDLLSTTTTAITKTSDVSDSDSVADSKQACKHAVENKHIKDIDGGSRNVCCACGIKIEHGNNNGVFFAIVDEKDRPNNNNNGQSTAANKKLAMTSSKVGPGKEMIGDQFHTTTKRNSSSSSSSSGGSGRNHPGDDNDKADGDGDNGNEKPHGVTCRVNGKCTSAGCWDKERGGDQHQCQSRSTSKSNSQSQSPVADGKRGRKGDHREVRKCGVNVDDNGDDNGFKNEIVDLDQNLSSSKINESKYEYSDPDLSQEDNNRDCSCNENNKSRSNSNSNNRNEAGRCATNEIKGKTKTKTYAKADDTKKRSENTESDYGDDGVHNYYRGCRGDDENGKERAGVGVVVVDGGRGGGREVEKGKRGVKNTTSDDVCVVNSERERARTFYSPNRTRPSCNSCCTLCTSCACANKWNTSATHKNTELHSHCQQIIQGNCGVTGRSGSDSDKKEKAVSHSSTQARCVDDCKSKNVDKKCDESTCVSGLVSFSLARGAEDKEAKKEEQYRHCCVESGPHDRNIIYLPENSSCSCHRDHPRNCTRCGKGELNSSSVCKSGNDSKCVLDEEGKQRVNCHCHAHRQQTTQSTVVDDKILDKITGEQDLLPSGRIDVCCDKYNTINNIVNDGEDEDDYDETGETSALISKVGNCCGCAIVCNNCHCSHCIVKTNVSPERERDTKSCSHTHTHGCANSCFQCADRIYKNLGDGQDCLEEEEEEDGDDEDIKSEQVSLLKENITSKGIGNKKGGNSVRFDLDRETRAGKGDGNNSRRDDRQANLFHASNNIDVKMNGDIGGGGGGVVVGGRLVNNKVGNHSENGVLNHSHTSDMENGISVISDRFTVDGVDAGGGGKYAKRTSVDTNNSNSINNSDSTGKHISDNKDGSGKNKKNVYIEEDNYGDDDGAKQCGFGPVRSRWCHRFRSPAWFVLVITLFSSCQGMAINGFVNTVISTLEKRFGINSTEGGLIASCYDIMFVILVIPVSYFGGHGNKPRYLACGSFIMGLGSFLFCLPHFISDSYEVLHADESVCRRNVTTDDYCEVNQRPDLSYYKYYFFFGQMLHGAGATALYTLAAVYVDENVSQRASSTYNAFFYTGAIIGPAIGYILGGQFLKTYTEMDVDPDSLGLTPNNPRWVGAWWVGFIMTGTFACLLAIPLLAFPPSLPGAHKFAEERGKEAHCHKGEDKTGHRKSLQDILLSVRLLLFNAPFMFINLALATDGALVSGFSTFLPKFIEYQQGLTASTSALYVGLAVVPAGGGATFIGGYLVTRFDLKVKGILRLCLGSCCVLMLLMFNFLLQCDTSPFAGVTVPYGPNPNSESLSRTEFDTSCNAGCGCVEENYYPMCGRDGILYFSPCYAGCGSVQDDGDVKLYSNCSCVNYNLTSEDVSSGDTHMGEFGKCEDSCKWLALFMIVVSFQIVLLFLKSMPALTVTLRCVPEHQRSFALGIQWIVARCLGSIPGPILFGKMFDISCSLWQKKCEGSGSCFYYDNKYMRIYLAIIAATFTVLTALFFFLANWFYVPKAPDPTVHLEIKLDRTTSQNTVMTDSAPPTPGEAFNQIVLQQPSTPVD